MQFRQPTSFRLASPAVLSAGHCANTYPTAVSCLASSGKTVPSWRCLYAGFRGNQAHDGNWLVSCMEHGGGSARSVQDCKMVQDLRGVGGRGRDRTGDPLLAKQVLSQLSYSPIPKGGQVVGLGRVELPTSPLSGVRSNHLSYRPAGALASKWWSWSGSNRRPPECKSGALPAELQPPK